MQDKIFQRDHNISEIFAPGVQNFNKIEINYLRGFKYFKYVLFWPGIKMRGPIRVTGPSAGSYYQW